jgi:Family of unknown function (DUF6152)
MRFRAILLAATFASVAGLVQAHHSAAAEYRAELKTWRGTITRFVWANPHTWVYFRMADAAAGIHDFECEGSAPGSLINKGWTRDTLTPGQVVTVEGYPAIHRPEGCMVRTILFADGRKMRMGSDQ